MNLPKRTTMERLRDLCLANGLYYYHVTNTKGRVLVYEDRYHYRKVGEVEVTDYRPIKNYKSMKPYGDWRTLRIIRGRIERNGDEYVVRITDPEEVEAIGKWLRKGK